MNAADVTARAMHYLRYKRQCPLIWTQRSPWNRFDHRPDVIGVTKDRRVIEVEVKVSIADFKANAAKRCMSERAPYDGPVWKRSVAFYFAVPDDLAQAVHPLLPDYAGLIVVKQNPWSSWVSKNAPRRANAPRLTTREMVEAARHLSGMLVSLTMQQAKLPESAEAA